MTGAEATGATDGQVEKSRRTLHDTPQAVNRINRLNNLQTVLNTIPRGLTAAQIMLLLPLIGPELGYNSITTLRDDFNRTEYGRIDEVRHKRQTRTRKAPTRSTLTATTEELKRRRAILEDAIPGLLQSHTLKEALSELGTSEVTVRKTIERLIEEGKLPPGSSFVPERPGTIDSLSEVLHNFSAHQADVSVDIPADAVDIRSLLSGLSRDQIRTVLVRIHNLQKQEASNPEIQTEIIALVASLTSSTP